MKHTDRLAYLQEMRGDNHRSVLFQAVFLMALGRLGYQMGRQTKWGPEHAVLGLLDGLSLDKVNYNAAKPDGGWNDRWLNAMMKQGVDTKTLAVKGYVFNNSRDDVNATYRQLAELAAFKISPRPRAGPRPDAGAVCSEPRQIVWVTFAPQAGHEPARRRPALVLSPKAYNAKGGLALVCPITSHQKRYPFEVHSPKRRVSGVVLADQLRRLDWSAQHAEKAKKRRGLRRDASGRAREDGGTASALTAIAVEIMRLTSRGAITRRSC